MITFSFAIRPPPLHVGNDYYMTVILLVKPKLSLHFEVSIETADIANIGEVGGKGGSLSMKCRKIPD